MQKQSNIQGVRRDIQQKLKDNGTTTATHYKSHLPIMRK